MRKAAVWLGALLGAGLILFVLKRDGTAPSRHNGINVSPGLSAAQQAPLSLPPSRTAARFRDATLVATNDIFDAATRQPLRIEIVKTRSKYPYIRVETPFEFDIQSQAWVPQPPVEYVADQVLVQLKAGVTQKQI